MLTESLESAAHGRGHPLRSSLTTRGGGWRARDQRAPLRSQSIEIERVREVDLDVVMDSEQRHRLISSRPGLGSRVFLLGDLDPEPITRRTVLDPVEKPAEVFRLCYDRIDRCVGALAALWRAPGDDDN